MQKNKNNELWGFGLIPCIFYLVFTALTYFKFKKQFRMEYADARVQDPLNFTLLIAKLCGLSFVAFLIVAIPIAEIVRAYKMHSLQSIYSSLPIFIFCFLIFCIISFFAIAYASRIATTQIGVLIYRQYDVFIIPCDVCNATFLDQLKLQWFRDMRNMEVLNLSQIVKITRGGRGKMLYIHGTFGTRGLMWRDKRKREECIYALQIACNRKLTDTIAYD